MSEAAIAPEVSAGALLRQARESAGLHVAALAVSLKVPVRKLEALEEDRYGDLPDAVFARALALTVCRNLKIDPQPVLARLPQTAAPRLVQAHEGINAPFRAPGDAVAGRWQQQLMRPAPLLVGVLLLSALAILLLPTLRIEKGAASSEAPAVPMAASVVVQPGANSGADAAAPAADPAPAPVAADGVSPDATASGRLADASAPAQAPAAVPIATPAPAAPTTESIAASAGPASGLVVFKASAPSWVQVVDSRGEVALRRLLTPGESAAASGSLPLSVIVGSASSTAVEVRGKPFDLAAIARDNVARFEVK